MFLLRRHQFAETQHFSKASLPEYRQQVSEALRSVATIEDPELKRIAFRELISGQRQSVGASWAESASKGIQVIAVVVGLVISVLSFNEARTKDLHTREIEAATRRLELEKYDHQRNADVEQRQSQAAQPFLELRQRLYLEAVAAAGVLANPVEHSEAEVRRARIRFRELYVAELSLVEGLGVEKAMERLAEVIDPTLEPFSKAQLAAYQLAHELRDSLAKSWKLHSELVDNPTR